MQIKFKAMGLALLIVSSTYAVAITAETTLYNINFESHATGAYASENLRSDWDIWWADFTRDDPYRFNIVQNNENKSLRITYPEGSVGGSQGGGGFCAYLPPEREEYEELWLSYMIKFEEGFDFRLGGKLPGLSSGGGTYTGGNLPTGGEGWNARFMWSNRNGRNPEGNSLMLYLYWVDQNSRWGDMIYVNAEFTRGKWHRITQRIKINTPNRYDGEIQVWFDDELVYSHTDMRWRIPSDTGFIDTFHFSTFHGGNTSDWAPRNDSYAQFDNFIISTEPPSFISGNAKLSPPVNLQVIREGIN